MPRNGSQQLSSQFFVVVLLAYMWPPRTARSVDVFRHYVTVLFNPCN